MLSPDGGIGPPVAGNMVGSDLSGEITIPRSYCSLLSVSFLFSPSLRAYNYWIYFWFILAGHNTEDSFANGILTRGRHCSLLAPCLCLYQLKDWLKDNLGFISKFKVQLIFCQLTHSLMYILPVLCSRCLAKIKPRQLKELKKSYEVKRKSSKWLIYWIAFFINSRTVPGVLKFSSQRPLKYTCLAVFQKARKNKGGNLAVF